MTEPTAAERMTRSIRDSITRVRNPLLAERIFGTTPGGSNNPQGDPEGPQTPPGAADDTRGD